MASRTDRQSTDPLSPQRCFRWMERACFVLGALLLGFFVSEVAQGELDRSADIEAFEETVGAGGSAFNFELSGTEHPDTTLWASGRKQDYLASLSAALPDVIGVMEIENIGLKVPVYASNTELVMDRGAGIVDGMAYPHEPGNIGISGHRDGYFRALKDVQPGDKLSLQTLEGVKQFRVRKTQVVEISDTSVLQDTDEQTVTLVTCYPFYFVGHAPQRFIVTATLDNHNVN